LRLDHFAEHAVRAEVERLPERLVAALRLVVVEAGRVDGPGSREQPERLISALRNERARRRGRGRFAGEGRAGNLRRQRGDGAVDRIGPGDSEESGRSALAKPETGRAQPDRLVGSVAGVARGTGGPFQLRAKLVRARAAAGDVVADMQDA